MIKVVIIEDELPASERLERLLSALPYSIQVVQKIESIEESTEYLTSHHSYDLVFMDIMLADGNSFDIFKKVSLEKPVIFTTAYDSYYIEAFQEYSLGYLLKPIKPSELENTMQKFVNFYYQIDKTDTLSEVGAQNPSSWMVRLGHQIKVVEKEEVAYYFTAHKITYLVTFDGKKWPLDYSLEYIEDHVSRENYFRINRQFIIHRKAIKEMTSTTKSRVKIKLIPHFEFATVSTLRSPLFKKWIKE